MQFIIFAILSVMVNATLDSIDHGKGARKLNYLWHILKQLNWICVFLVGAYFVIPYAWDIIKARIIASNWLWLILIILFWFLWELVYRTMRKIFDKYGLPDWFIKSESQNGK